MEERLWLEQRVLELEQQLNQLEEQIRLLKQWVAEGAVSVVETCQQENDVTPDSERVWLEDYSGLSG